MRISLLLEREPFPEILEKTLSRFWTEQYGRAYTVRWHRGDSDRGGQRWLVNVYLNAIFRPDAAPAVFEPIRREFTHSPVRWRRLIQPAYVNAALSHPLAARLAQSYLIVEPPVPDAEHKLIVAGNHKIRLLDRQRAIAYGILKAGFSPRFMQQEIAARREADACGVPVPALVEIGEDGRWFCERYISGTPINRLAHARQAHDAALAAARSLGRLLARTRQEIDQSAYVRQLQAHITELIEAHHLLDAGDKAHLLRQTDLLVEGAKAKRGLTTALTHGDFQPANILVNEEGVWLIDWEYAARRQAGYDALVFVLAARTPQGLAQRLQNFVDAGWPPGSWIEQADWPGLKTANREERMAHATLFLLEELALHLEENSQPLFTRLGQGLRTLQEEIDQWLKP